MSEITLPVEFLNKILCKYIRAFVFETFGRMIFQMYVVILASILMLITIPTFVSVALKI